MYDNSRVELIRALEWEWADVVPRLECPVALVGPSARNLRTMLEAALGGLVIDFPDLQSAVSSLSGKTGQAGNHTGLSLSGLVWLGISLDTIAQSIASDTWESAKSPWARLSALVQPGGRTWRPRTMAEGQLDGECQSMYRSGIENRIPLVGDLLDGLPFGLQSVPMSLDLFGQWVDAVREAGFRCVGYEDVFRFSLDCECGEGEDFPQERLLLLRHDVDFDPACALLMAEREAQAGLRATYFFLNSGRFYNPMSPENRDAVRRIAELGHEVGVHVDIGEDLEVSRAFLEAVTGKAVSVFSQHDPEIRGLDAAVRDGWRNAYDRRIAAAGFEYCSDSGKRWRGESALEALRHRRLYVLLHPELWVKGHLDVVQAIRYAAVRRTGEVARTFSDFAEQQIPYLRGGKA